MIAVNAEPIIKARLQGFKPDEMIVVSLVGSAGMGNHIVHAKADTTYNWRWVRGLDICLCIGQQDDWAPLLKEIALHRPEHLSVWNCVERWGAKVYLIPTAEDIAKPVHQWGYELDFLPWLDFQNEDFI